MVSRIDREVSGLVTASREDAEHIASVRRHAKQASDLARLKGANSVLQRELSLSEQRVAALELLNEQPPRVYEPPKSPGGTRRGTLVLLCSDWHVGERVESEAVGGRNRYTPEVAAKRVDKLIEGARWLIESWRGPKGYGWSLDELVIWLGGDLMTGMIHDDLAETNALAPLEEMALARDLSVHLIEALARDKGIKRIRVPTSRGNHGRDTPKRRVSSGYKRSYEQAAYIDIAKRYEHNSKVEVLVSADTFQRLNVYRTRVRFHHGDCIGFGGGVGGLTIPLRKAIAEWNKTEWADVTCLGHWHQFLDLPDAVVNNCLIGWGAYAQEIKAPFAPASQVAFLVDEKWGKRMATEIIVQ